jgi:hypothetical protein
LGERHDGDYRRDPLRLAIDACSPSWRIVRRHAAALELVFAFYAILARMTLAIGDVHV